MLLDVISSKRLCLLCLEIYVAWIRILTNDIEHSLNITALAWGESIEIPCLAIYSMHCVKVFVTTNTVFVEGLISQLGRCLSPSSQIQPYRKTTPV